MTASTALPGAQKSISKKKRSGSGSGSQGEGKVATPRHCAKVGTAPTNIPQVSWAAVWQMYGQRCNENAEANVDNSGAEHRALFINLLLRSRAEFCDWLPQAREPYTSCSPPSRRAATISILSVRWSWLKARTKTSLTTRRSSVADGNGVRRYVTFWPPWGQGAPCSETYSDKVLLAPRLTSVM
jgi:hypothetical protein